MRNTIRQLPVDVMHLRQQASRAQVTKMVMRLLRQWKLTSAEQLKLLGLSETSRGLLTRYRNQETVIPFDQDKLVRAGFLLAIYKNIYDLFPHNKAIQETWIKRKNDMLKGLRPLDIMLENGQFGMANIMRFLDMQKVT